VSMCIHGGVIDKAGGEVASYTSRWNRKKQTRPMDKRGRCSCQLKRRMHMTLRYWI
jgi:hypothetical protein